ncbi:hypothetical protein EDC96DRAFT_547112 [Choanephora cucurbitarum]|nr:hypothetical protein EDC96DRAFT_547112 [Choanephora cucurbitarum]
MAIEEEVLKGEDNDERLSLDNGRRQRRKHRLLQEALEEVHRLPKAKQRRSRRLVYLARMCTVSRWCVPKVSNYIRREKVHEHTTMYFCAHTHQARDKEMPLLMKKANDNHFITLSMKRGIKPTWTLVASEYV